MSSPFENVEPPELRARLQRFVQIDPALLVATAALSPRVAQLATSFSLLFAMVATGHATPDEEAEAIRRVEAGLPLRAIAAALSVPYCLRHLPPEACPDYWPRYCWTLSASRLLSSYLPPTATSAAHWLRTINFAALRGDETIAVWFASRHELSCSTALDLCRFEPLILFAWVSRHQPELLGPCLPWTDRLTAHAAVDRCNTWMGYFACAITLGPDGVPDPWIEETTYDGLAIVPLTTIEAIAAEARAMRNCLIDYAPSVADDICRLFSIRADDHRIATMEVTRDALDRLVLENIEGPEHTEPTPELMRAMQRFLKSKQKHLGEPSPTAEDAAGLHMEALLARYRAALPESEQDAIDDWTWHGLRAHSTFLDQALSCGTVGGEPLHHRFVARRHQVVVVERRRRTQV